MSFPSFREGRLLSYYSGPEMRPVLRQPEQQPMAPVPPELEAQYRQTMAQLALVLQQMERAGVPPQTVMGQMNGRLPYPFGMYPDGVRPFQPILRRTNLVSPYLIGSPNARLPWNFMPRSWRDRQTTFVPGVGLGTTPYGVPPYLRRQMYQGIQYPLPEVPFRLPNTPVRPPLPNLPAEPLNRDPRANFLVSPRQPMLPSLPPSLPRPESYAPLAPVRESADLTADAAVTFNYDGPPQAITLAVNGQMIALPTLPADGQTIQDPRGFRLSRRGNTYSLVYGRF